MYDFVFIDNTPWDGGESARSGRIFTAALLQQLLEWR